jgi:hypothetical protein
VSPNSSKSIKDFSGTTHSSSVKGHLLATTQKVLVMETSKVNLASTEQFFRTIVRNNHEQNFVLFDAKSRPLLTAHNPGDGSYICTVKDLTKAFGNMNVEAIAHHTLTIEDPPDEVTIYSSNVDDLNETQDMTKEDDKVLLPRQYFSNDELQRAEQARALHELIGHPGDHVLIKTLKNNNLEGTHLNAQDVRNAADIFDTFVPCLQGKVKVPREPTSQSPPASSIGENIQCDIIPIPTSIGGNNHILFTVDDKSDHDVAMPMSTKSTTQLVKAMDVVIQTYHQYGHTVKHFTSDDEANLKSTLPYLRVRKISHSTTPAGLHEKKSERSIQTLKYRQATIKAGLSYILPAQFESEAIMAVVDQLNFLPTTNTGTTTPLEAFTGRKPKVPAFAFGTIGVVYHPRQDDNTLRGEIGIFLSHGQHRRYIKGFIPTRDKTYSVRQLTQLREQVTPFSW